MTQISESVQTLSERRLDLLPDGGLRRREGYTARHGRRTSRDVRHVAILGSRGFPSTYGGYETLVRHLARDWTSDGLTVTVYCREKPSRASAWFEEGVKCRWTPGIDSKALSTLTFGATSQLDAGTRGFDAALVLNIANGIFLPVLRRAGVPTVVNTDGLEWERGKWGRVAKRTFRYGAEMCARHADVVVADSRAMGDIWHREFGVRCQFIPYGADVVTQVACESILPLGLRPGAYALVVARLVPENNVELILDAMKLVEGPKPPLVVVGAANYRSELSQRLMRLSERGEVKWLDHVHDQRLLQQLWSNASVYMHGHSVGGTNPALLQALGFGAPTLALDTRFNGEVMNHEHEQLFPHDPARLAQMIRDVVADPARRERFRARGQAIVAERYRWDSVVQDYFEALREARTRLDNRIARYAERIDEAATVLRDAA
jgi:glycosyltransferase involved in cell wall biosynthesis